ncbi:GAF and ANTAR domain-containing protein [Paenarthrobacter sp. Z7-10]|uniref:GAF and ANTAR domain-containing protein n=1 Tax=Paenarthrobacter sp. Z7-10 TaxID=2787635 RepID=UPI0022A9838A|nr:GAF and ANTAR domain-containing protein [Paenarthrobacter sp. Z7-10]MCZ2402221.1 GAF and ANTAR domain-containing protein [Paenarthrobacter sp. Z7-10]
MAIDTSQYHDSPASAVNDYLQSLILESHDIGAFLDGLARFSAESLSTAGDEVLCGITLLRDRKAATVASSSEYARKMDEIQYSFGDGPCMTASREQITIHVPDLELNQRWPEYAATVLEHGIRSILAVPFNLEGDARAALNLYSEQVGKFDSAALEKAETYTRATSKALRLGLRFAQHVDTATDLRSALESRTIIDLAVGIIMAQNRCGQGSAIEILKSASGSRNIKLRDVAATLVESISDEAPSTHFDY